MERDGRRRETNEKQYDAPTIPEKQISDERDEVLKAKAQDILPCLTLDRLEEHEIMDLLRLSDGALIIVAKANESPDQVLSANMTLESDIARVSGDLESWEEGKVSPKLQQARKLVSAFLMNEANTNNPKKNWAIRNTFFGMLPNLSSYCGDLRDSLELLTIADRAGQNPCANDIYEEIIYNHSFAEKNDFEEILHNSTPIQQLRLLPIYETISQRCDEKSYTRGALKKIIQSLDTVKRDERTKPLVSLVASQIDNDIKRRLEMEWIEVDESDPEYRELIEEYKQRQLAWRAEQDRLHDEFPALPKNRVLDKIDPETVGALGSNSSIVQIANKQGDTLSLLGYLSNNAFGLDINTALLVSAAHNPGVKELISDKIGFKLDEIPLESQVQFLKFMVKADSGRFKNLCDTLVGADKKLRLKILENFVAADFGEDFGDSLLTIAGSERLADGEKEKIFDMINSCRKSIEKITGLFEGFYGGRFAKQCARAANERLTDAIAAFGKIAKNGKVDIKLDLGGWANFNLSSALEALEYETKSLEIISGVIGDVANGEKGAYAMRIISPKTDNHSKFFSMYHLYSPDYGYVLLYTRSEASHSYTNSKEYGKRGSRYDKNSKAGVEASISFIVNPVDPKSMINPDKPSREAMKNKNYYDPSTMDKVSAFRLDREGRESGMPANDPNRDSINPRGMVSVDLAAILDRKDTPSGKIARLISAGGKIRELASGKKSSLNHNTNWFDHERYGSYEGFAKLVRYLDREVMKWCERESDKKIGKKALKAMMAESLGRKSVGAA